MPVNVTRQTVKDPAPIAIGGYRGVGRLTVILIKRAKKCNCLSAEVGLAALMTDININLP